MPTRLLRAFLLLTFGLAALASPALAGPRPPDPLDAAGIRLALARLRVTGSVLYVAAHPDDENTAMLAWLANERLVRTAYLSLTRGDGGQNLIGHELGPELGILRTQELLAARRLDGAEQYFTRAVDFGFSKNPTESFEIWNRDSVLCDVVRVIRRFRPDVIVTRFPVDGGGHGHHTASAIVAEEAFAAAADARRFPQCGPAWQAKRLMWNAWTPDTSKVDTTWLRVDVGGYNALLGRSYGEIAATSRSNHKSQGFGVPERHGALPQWLAPRAGAPPKRDLLDGVELTWKRFGGGERIDALLERAAREFDDAHPAASLARLAEVERAMAALRESDPVIAARRADLAEVIRSCAGLWIEAVAPRATVAPGESLAVAVTVITRTTGAIVQSITVAGTRLEPLRSLPPNASGTDTLRLRIAPDREPDQPSWLREAPGRGLYPVPDADRIGWPEDLPALPARIELLAGGAPLVVELPVAYRWADPVQGERWRAALVAPPATLDFEHGTYLFPDGSPREVDVTVQAQVVNAHGRLSLALPSGWTCTPPAADVKLAQPGEESRVRFLVTPAAGPARGSLEARLDVDGRTWSNRLVRIDHPHVPPQSLFPPARVPTVRADIRTAGRRVAYVAGSGDAIPDALHQLGYEVVTLTDEQIASADLSRFDAIVAGVRAFNTRPRLLALKSRLFDYVHAGGTLLVQYNTLGEGVTGDLGPYPFRISRDRVTSEDAPVRVLGPSSPVLLAPNRIGESDWDGWVQERGLYFAGPWDPHYSTPLSCNDPGEPARDGGLLVAPWGKGVFAYCGYALFRQLPAGVPGAWRLFANLVSARAPVDTP